MYKIDARYNKHVLNVYFCTLHTQFLPTQTLVSIVKKSSAFAFHLIIAIQFECFFFVLYIKTFRSFHFDFLYVAPQPPQRDPQTSLSVGKAQGKQYAEGMAELGMYIYAGI